MTIPSQANADIVVNGLRLVADGYSCQGSQSSVHRLIHKKDQNQYALKVMKGVHRHPFLVRQAERLKTLTGMPGLSLSDREVLHPAVHKELILEKPDFLYAVFMPWIEGNSWQEIVEGKQTLSKEDCLTLARSLAQCLTALEGKGMAHCQLTGENVLIDGSRERVELADLEHVYAPGWEKPPPWPATTTGYSHRSGGSPDWTPLEDRYAGSIMLAELLAWHTDEIRAAAWGRSFFDPSPSPRNDERAELLANTLEEHYGRMAADLLRRAWRAESLEDCPSFAQWQSAIAADVDHIEAAEPALAEPSAAQPAAMTDRRSPELPERNRGVAEFAVAVPEPSPTPARGKADAIYHYAWVAAWAAIGLASVVSMFAYLL
jgi:hypothetical protein